MEEKKGAPRNEGDQLGPWVGDKAILAEVANWPEKRKTRRDRKPDDISRLAIGRAEDAIDVATRTAALMEAYHTSQGGRQRLALWIKATVRKHFAETGKPITFQKLRNRWSFAVKERFRLPLYDYLRTHEGYEVVEWFDGDTPRCVIWHCLDWKKLTPAEKSGPVSMGLGESKSRSELKNFFSGLEPK